METKSEQLTYMEALSEAKLTALPDEYVGGSDRMWIKAIVKVRKCTGIACYAIAVNNGDNTPGIIRDFGSPAAIVRVENIYPYLWVDKAALPDLRNKQDIIDYLSDSGYNADDIAKMLSTKMPDGSQKSTECQKKDKEIVKKFVYSCVINQELSRKKDIEYLEQ